MIRFSYGMAAHDSIVFTIYEIRTVTRKNNPEYFTKWEGYDELEVIKPIFIILN